MGRLLQIFNNLVFGYSETKFYKDVRFWLLLIVINCGANLGFNYHFDQQATKIVLFFICLYLLCIRKCGHMVRDGAVFIVAFALILFLQSIYVEYYSITTSIHYLLMISIAVMTVSICGRTFTRYFSSIIFVYAVISLCCFFAGYVGIQIPYIPITESSIDGGKIMRVYNIYYTQLGNPLSGITYSPRNCGPFWEPGAYQGFLNLSLFFELTMKQDRNSMWLIRILILIITIITTISTGGYIVLFVILTYYFSRDKGISTPIKAFLSLSMMYVIYLSYTTLDFLGDKIENDSGRLSFSFTDFSNPLYIIFGYGYSPESFKDSSIVSASSIFNLFRYMGIIGFGCYFVRLLFNKCPLRLIYFIIICLILTNEPFLSNAMIWWAMPFVSYDLYRNQKYNI